jgi:hypothetical protein
MTWLPLTSVTLERARSGVRSKGGNENQCGQLGVNTSFCDYDTAVGMANEDD